MALGHTINDEQSHEGFSAASEGKIQLLRRQSIYEGHLVEGITVDHSPSRQR